MKDEDCYVRERARNSRLEDGKRRTNNKLTLILKAEETRERKTNNKENGTREEPRKTTSHFSPVHGDRPQVEVLWHVDDPFGTPTAGTPAKPSIFGTLGLPSIFGVPRTILS